MKKVLLILSLFSFSLAAHPGDVVRLNSRSVHTHPSLGNVCLSHKNGEFTVYHEGKVTKVAREDSDPMIRTMSACQLRAFLEIGKVRVNRYSNGDYKLNAYATVEGGGPGTAWFLYGITKGVGYALPVAWTIVSLTEGNPQPGVEQIGKVAAKHAGKAIAAKVVTETAAKAAGQQGGAIAYTVVKEVGTKTTGEVMGGIATGGGYFAGVETIANAAYWVGMSIPWLP